MLNLKMKAQGMPYISANRKLGEYLNTVRTDRLYDHQTSLAVKTNPS